MSSLKDRIWEAITQLEEKEKHCLQLANVSKSFTEGKHYHDEAKKLAEKANLLKEVLNSQFDAYNHYTHY